MWLSVSIRGYTMRAGLSRSSTLSVTRAPISVARLHHRGGGSCQSRRIEAASKPAAIADHPLLLVLQEALAAGLVAADRQTQAGDQLRLGSAGEVRHAPAVQRPLHVERARRLAWRRVLKRRHQATDHALHSHRGDLGDVQAADVIGLAVEGLPVVREGVPLGALERRK